MQIVQISMKIEDKQITYYLPSRNPKKVIVVTDCKDSIDSLEIREVLLSTVQIPTDTWSMINTRQTLDKLAKG